MARRDPHSYHDDEQPKIRHLDLELAVNFDDRVLEAVATVELDRPPGGSLDLDTRDLALRSVVDDRGETVRFELAPEDPILGRRLRLFTDRRRISIEYRTSPDATALQWLEPTQTAGGQKPYVFTQCQAIHARSVLPCQDTPSVRFGYDVRVRVPDGLTPVFAAAPGGVEGKDHRFSMPQPIPAYLFAFAVGDLGSRELSTRSRVWGEEQTLDVAASDFARVEDMIEAAESLFGPYAWDRFDLLVMPPSFPYGGMENPRLTFLTPTLLTGDGSLANVVAHELAHAWTGNLVTNASAEHFWLNEGFTVYAERRIVEALEGPASAALQAAIGRRDLAEDMSRLEKIDPKLTALRTELEGRDPDQVFSTVPYEKGYLFLRALEEAVGRSEFDDFLRAYIATHRFRSLTTEAFVEFLRNTLPEAVASVDVERWLYEPGLPADAPEPASRELEAIEALARKIGDGARPRDQLKSLSPTEWQVLLSALPDDLPHEELRWLEVEFRLADAPNAEIRVQWLGRLAPHADMGCEPAIRQVLNQWGRMKYLRPLYAGLLRRGPEGRALAEDIFAEACDRYHPVAQGVVADLLGTADA